MVTDEKFAELAAMVSELGGQLLAQNAAICAIFRCYASGQPLPEAVYEHLERVYAGQLAQSTNEHATAGFEEVRRLYLLALDIKEQGGPDGPPYAD